MKCVYYSKYPYKADDYKCVSGEHFTNKEGQSWSGDAFDMPFRLYKAAECTNISHANRDVAEFIWASYEAMDCPYANNRNKHLRKYIFRNGVRIMRTKHFYGATNELDGIFEVDKKFYVIKNSHIIEYSPFEWEEAFHLIRKDNPFYLRGYELTKIQ